MNKIKNDFFFQFEMTNEQIQYAQKLVEYSISNHPVQDIFHRDPGGAERQREFRTTGTLGEIAFADAYELPRPTRSFGAVDGQDFGQDFILKINDQPHSFDIKTMGRKNNNFRTNYVLNLPLYQMKRPDIITEYYFCVSLHKNDQNRQIVSFIGYVSKQEIQHGTIGILYKAGTKRVKDDGSSFIFQRDTYEIDFKDITTPILTEKIRLLPGFKIKKILLQFKKEQ
ncbi:MAG: hypothetical protein Q7R95_06580 [bacterium]|nr:hypothetical protein [bacterium]